jgi:hypothetical protein
MQKQGKWKREYNTNAIAEKENITVQGEYLIFSQRSE